MRTLERKNAMATIDVVNLAGQKVGSLELAQEVFGAVNEDLLWESVQHYRAAQRAGTHATKNKKLVSGSGKKLWRQKGTGRARVGSVRSPIWRHGGTVHGPQPRSYDYAFPRKKLLGALRSALAAKLADGKLVVVDSLDLTEAKTKSLPAGAGGIQVRQNGVGGGIGLEPESEPGALVAQHCRRRDAVWSGGSSLSPAAS
jgi:large subunit ribosomal protein L4